MLDFNENLLFSIHGGSDSDGFIGLIERFLGNLQAFLSMSADERYTALLPGLAALPNIHPLFVHFPISFLSAFFVIDLLGSLLNKKKWRQAADWFLYLGLVSACLTILAGLQAASTVPHTEEVHEIMETHQRLGISIFLATAGLSIWRLIVGNLLKGAANFCYLSIAGLVCILLVLTGDLGGLMVYRYGVGTQVSSGSTIEHAEEHHHEHSH